MGENVSCSCWVLSNRATWGFVWVFDWFRSLPVRDSFHFQKQYFWYDWVHSPSGWCRYHPDQIQCRCCKLSLSITSNTFLMACGLLATLTGINKYYQVRPVSLMLDDQVPVGVVVFLCDQWSWWELLPVNTFCMHSIVPAVYLSILLWQGFP